MFGNKISEIQFIPIQPRDGLIGFASFVYDNSIKISGIGVHSTLKGDIRLVYPTGKFGYLVQPINKDIGFAVYQAVKIRVDSLLSHYGHSDSKG